MGLPLVKSFVIVYITSAIIQIFMIRLQSRLGLETQLIIVISYKNTSVNLDNYYKKVGPFVVQNG